LEKIKNPFQNFLLKIHLSNLRSLSLPDENQVKEAFVDEGRGHLPSHLKFFLLVFSKIVPPR